MSAYAASNEFEWCPRREVALFVFGFAFAFEADRRASLDSWGPGLISRAPVARALSSQRGKGRVAISVES